MSRTVFSGRETILVSLRCVRTTESSPYTHLFKVSLPNLGTIFHKLLEFAPFRVSRLYPFPNPTTCSLSNLDLTQYLNVCLSISVRALSRRSCKRSNLVPDKLHHCLFPYLRWNSTRAP